MSVCLVLSVSWFGSDLTHIINEVSHRSFDKKDETFQILCVSTHTWLGYCHIFFSQFSQWEVDFLNLVSLFLQTVPSLTRQWCDQLAPIKWSIGCKAQVKNHRHCVYCISPNLTFSQKCVESALCSKHIKTSLHIYGIYLRTKYVIYLCLHIKCCVLYLNIPCVFFVRYESVQSDGYAVYGPEVNASPPHGTNWQPGQ